MNRLVGQKISSISSKPQTTRIKIAGIRTIGETQLVFYDTPGLLKARDRLERGMVHAVKESLADTDVALLVVEPSGNVSKAEQAFIELFKKKNIPVILVINKIDLVKNKEELIPRIEQYKDLYPFAAILPLSAKKKDGIDRLEKEILPFAYESVHFFPDEMITDQPERVLASELLREKILIYMRDEIPHGVIVQTETFCDKKDAIKIDCVIYCEKQNHKGMIIGKNGEMLKKIASSARRDMEELFGKKVRLTCWVKVKEGWKNEQKFLQQFGLTE